MSQGETVPSPTPAEIRSAREAARLTQAQAADLVHSTDRVWRYWEAGNHSMPAALWELFQIKLAQRAEADA